MKTYFYYGHIINDSDETIECCGLVNAKDPYTAFEDLKNRYSKYKSFIIKQFGVVE